MRFLQPLNYVDAIARAGSIRRAAATLAITSTALNRRVLALEEELGAPLFERLPGGVRLSAAGELFVHHARRELAEMRRLRLRIDDLSGERRGHVAVGCGQALMHSRMPGLITEYREAHPAVTFDVRVCTRDDAGAALSAYDIDLAVVFEPTPGDAIETIARATQAVRLICRRDHPLVAGHLDRVGRSGRRGGHRGYRWSVSRPACRPARYPVCRPGSRTGRWVASASSVGSKPSPA